MYCVGKNLNLFFQATSRNHRFTLSWCVEFFLYFFMKNIILILIALILFSCSNYPENWNIDMSRKNAVMVLIDGTKIHGELKSFNYDTGQFKFISSDNNIYTSPLKVKYINDIWDYPLLPESNIRLLNNKRKELGLSEKSGDEVMDEEFSRRQEEYKYAPRKDNAKLSRESKQVLSSILSDLEKSISNSNSSSTVEFDSGQPKGCHIFGKIKFVQFGGDYKVRMVGMSPNLKVKYVSYGASTQGNWQIVDFGEDYKIELVQAGEDFSVQIVDFGQGCN